MDRVSPEPQPFDPAFSEAPPLPDAPASGGFVLLVDGANTVVRRNVELGDRFDDKVLVLRGLEAGDRVIVRGLQLVRPGMPVRVQEVTDPNDAQAG